MEIELSRIIRAIRRYWWVVAASMVVFALAAALVWSAMPKTYTASVKLLVLPSEYGGISLTETGGSVATYIELAESDAVLSTVMQEFDIDGTTDAFRDSIEVSNILGTDMILIQVTDTDPQRAAHIANSLTASFVVRVESVTLGVLQTKRDDLVFERDQIDLQLATATERVDQLTGSEDDMSSEDQAQLVQMRQDQIRLQQKRADLDSIIRNTETQLATIQSRVMVSDSATVPGQPDGVALALQVVLGAFLGALVGLALMLPLELHDSRIRDPRHLAELTNVRSIVPMKWSVNAEANAAAIRLFGARILGLADSAHLSHMLLVSPRRSDAVDRLAQELESATELQQLAPKSLDNLLETQTDANLVPEKTGSVLLVDKSCTTERDVTDTVNILNDLGVPVISAALLG